MLVARLSFRVAVFPEPVISAEHGSGDGCHGAFGDVHLDDRNSDYAVLRFSRRVGT